MTYPREGWMGRACEPRNWDDEEGIAKTALFVWNPTTLTWERMTQPLIDATNSQLYLVVDELEARIGALTDAEAAGNGSLNALLKRIRTLLASVPVTGTFWQATQPISAVSLPLPADAATQTTLALIKAKTDNLDALLSAVATQATLALIKAKTDNLDALLSSLATQATLASLLTELQLKADLTETQPVSAVTLPLPSGAATQTTLASLLTELQAKADLAETQPVSLATAPSTPVTGTFWQATQPVSGTVTANPATYAGKTLTYVSVNQGAAGTTTLAAASVGNKHKLLGAMLVMSLLGSLKLTDGVVDLSGPTDIAANGGFVIPPSLIPWTETAATNRALNLVTTLGAARGMAIILTEA